MKEISRVPATADHVLECSVCEERIKECDTCGKYFNDGEEILHVVHNTFTFHVCSEECDKEFVDLDIKMAVPA